jgi:hypothetical protein
MIVALLAAMAIGQTPTSREAMLARARALELKTAYAPPPGDPLEHHAAGLAKVICSGCLSSPGSRPTLPPRRSATSLPPMPSDRRWGGQSVDRQAKRVTVTLPNGVVRTAIYTGDQGCLTLPKGATRPDFTPVKVPRNLPDSVKTPWPMGDRLPANLPAGIDLARVQQALDAAFTPASGETAALVVTWKGRLIGERYGKGIDHRTPLRELVDGQEPHARRSWGILIRQGALRSMAASADPGMAGGQTIRAAKIRIADILHMSSGLRIRAPQDPDYDASLGYPDHLYLYTGTVDSFKYAATRPLQWPPNTVGRYRNTDPVLINYLNRLGIEKQKEVYHTFPQRRLFDKLGIRTMIMETDPYGNFLTQGYEFASGRDWARLGNLYLQDGVWNGERILPEGFVKFVSTLAPAWEADGRPIYGGFFWLNGNDEFPVPREAYFMAGAGGQ